MCIKKFLSSKNVWENSGIKVFFSGFVYIMYPWFPLVLKWFRPFRSIVAKNKELVVAVTLGFLFATIRSCCKKIYTDDGKPNIKLLPSYLINYPIVLGLIFTLGSYYCEVKNVPPPVSIAMLFVLGFFADSVFDVMKDAHKIFLKLLAKLKIWS